MIVPILSIIGLYKCNIASITMVYSAINIIIKIVSIIIVLTVSWKHVGMCYINYQMKVIVICSSVA